MVMLIVKRLLLLVEEKSILDVRRTYAILGKGLGRNCWRSYHLGRFFIDGILNDDNYLALFQNNVVLTLSNFIS